MSRQVWQGEREIDLSYKEFDLLACLMHNSGVALSRDLLLERVWGSEFPGSNRTIDVHIRWLREKLEYDPANPMLIHTVRGIGYRFQDPALAVQRQQQGAEAKTLPSCFYRLFFRLPGEKRTYKVKKSVVGVIPISGCEDRDSYTTSMFSLLP